MVRIEDDCVGCSPPLDCLGPSCPYRRVTHYYCDNCGEDAEALYELNGQELCRDCVLESLPKVD